MVETNSLPIPAALPPLRWVPSPNFYPGRGGNRTNLLVLHDTEGSYAGSISWFAQRASKVSAHFVIREDGGEATQMVDLGDRAWHVCAFNGTTIGFEMAGLASKGFGAPEWLAAASIIAHHLHFLGLPNRWAKGGVGPGFCRHYDLGRAGGGHSDPTTDETVWAHFCDLVTNAYEHGNFPAVWEAEHINHKCPLGGLSAPAAISPAAAPKSSPAAPPDTANSFQEKTNSILATFAAAQAAKSAIKIGGEPVTADQLAVARQIFEFFTGKVVPQTMAKLVARHAIGFVANAWGETRLQPYLWGDRTKVYNGAVLFKAYGLFQMHHDDRLTAACNALGFHIPSPPAAGQTRGGNDLSIEQQLDVAWNDLTRPELVNLITISHAATANDAAMQICRLWERAGASDAAERRGAWAEEWEKALSAPADIV